MASAYCEDLPEFKHTLSDTSLIPSLGTSHIVELPVPGNSFSFYPSIFIFSILPAFFNAGDILKVEFKLVENCKKGKKGGGISQGSQLS
jgi:hypothetical protein